MQEELLLETQNQDKLLNKRTILVSSQQQKQRAIQELGTVPRKELSEFQSLTEKVLLKKLHSVNNKLKKYASVNRKALDQYVSFSAQRESLLSRKEELKRDSTAIHQLVASLDLQKEEAILRTFRGVSKHFTEVFHELVPGGTGHLVMRTAADNIDSAAGAGDGDVEGAEKDADLGEDSDGDGHGDAGASIAVSSLRGVQVRVSFSGSGQQLQMQQLSGGQKALVALALIFAIQRYDMSCII